MNQDDLKTSYSAIGNEILQYMYSEDYLSIGGQESTVVLAEKAGIDASARVLDIGCGIGGPAIDLAATFGCSVAGIDLMPHSIAQANDRAARRGVGELATFSVGDAQSVPFPDESFTHVWGKDAWCHVPDKAQLMAESARVLVDDGVVAFTDWTSGSGVDDDYREQLLAAIASPSLESQDGYVALLERCGLSVEYSTDMSAQFTEQYASVMQRLSDDEGSIVERYNQRVFDVVMEKNAFVCDAFATGRLGGVMLVACKSA
jgi:ubiquinone/menaquinone biosynthesis C-methylase UbiE